MDDHDQRFKGLLREFLPEFLRLFFPEWAEGLDAPRAVWLEQEAVPDPFTRRTHRLDLVARVGRRPRPAEQGGDWIVHIEIESGDRAARLRPRMFVYYTHLRRRYRLPVLPIGLFLRAGLGGVGRDVFVDRLGDWPLVRFEYASVGLPALDAVPFARGSNALGIALASLMRLPREGRPQLKVALVRRVTDLERTEFRRLLLLDCIEAYFPLDEGERAGYRSLLRAAENQEVRKVLTIFEINGQRTILEKMIEKRFGPLSPVARQKLENWPGEELADLGLALLDARSLHDLGLDDDSPAPKKKTRKR
jgi:hypothetical protein